MAAGKPGPVIPDRYVSALAGSDPLKSMRKAPKRLRKLIRGLSEEQLAARPAPGKWSIKEVVAHLADGEVMIGSRYRLVAAMERPPLVGYDQDAFVENLYLDEVSTKTLLKDFKAARRANMRLLERLPEAAFERVGLHNERGDESLARMLVLYSGHDLIHEAQIERLRAGLCGDTLAPAAKPAPVAAKAKPKVKPKRSRSSAR